MPRSADPYPEAAIPVPIPTPTGLWAERKTWLTLQRSLSCSLELELVPLTFRIQQTLGRFNFFTKQAENTHSQDRNSSGCLLGSLLVAGCVATEVLSLSAFPKVFLCPVKGSHPHLLSPCLKQSQWKLVSKFSSIILNQRFSRKCVVLGVTGSAKEQTHLLVFGDQITLRSPS